MASERSNSPDVRNPLLGLPAMARLRNLPADVRGDLQDLLMDIAADARKRAEHCWRISKAPMAAYWKAVAVYANHTRRALR